MADSHLIKCPNPSVHDAALGNMSVCVTAGSLLQYFYDDIIRILVGGIPRAFSVDTQQPTTHA